MTLFPALHPEQFASTGEWGHTKSYRVKASWDPRHSVLFETYGVQETSRLSLQ